MGSFRGQYMKNIIYYILILVIVYNVYLFASDSEIDWFADEKNISLSENIIQKYGIKTYKVTKKYISKSVLAPGIVAPDESKIVTITARVDGWVEKLFADYTGKYVKKDSPIVEIYSPEVQAVKGELKIIKNLKNEIYGNELYRTTIEKLRYLGVDPEKMDINGPTYTIYSPIDGFITEKNVFVGSRISKNNNLMTIVDLSKIWIIADVYEEELAYIDKNHKAKITLVNFNKNYDATVDYIYPEISAETRTGKVRFIILNEDTFLKPNMYVKVKFFISSKESLSMPKSAILGTGKENIVFIKVDENTYKPKKVSIGFRGDNFVEITSGVKEGNEVIVDAGFILDSEAKLKGITYD
jgi:Cu(I)/Ag(I) efflux system membrane fusion protein